MNNKNGPRKFVKQNECTIRTNSTSKVVINSTPTPKVSVDDESIKDITEDLAMLIAKTIQTQIANELRDYQNYKLEWGMDSDKYPAVQIQKIADQ
jgi:hypothetical protein